MFSTFGILTAVMIALALVAALVVLPSVLLLVTREPQRRALQAAATDDRELLPLG